MAIRVKRFSQYGIGEPGYFGLDDTTREQRETTVDGYTFHWGPNEVRNFLDDGVGIAHGAFAPGASIIENPIPFGSGRS